jgi:hypothetical protein
MNTLLATIADGPFNPVKSILPQHHEPPEEQAVFADFV